MLTTTFAALADPTRLAVVTQLSRGEATMGELATPHALSPPAMTKHVGVLVDAGLVTRRKVGRTVVCTIRPEALSEVEVWLGDLTAYWNRTVDRLADLLEGNGDEH
ncbi:transcriptional regulator, ArsR family [Kribbella flavida DSM 17836]|uniref:Transcriptional regulator, ArsR family n=1 Tax=Kribbella flavida (strain DSM 17836 / JCM 10339 / NBRC 14399) TaxID=479435 RepID=D2PN71_KRIFD|nr:metalloregulator ArsR/SmtB family transcription factor [Kribbella flavida]ADB34555.1 transcriptional regulator, ArsR family [Kribbella flavida DSM 17836]